MNLNFPQYLVINSKKEIKPIFQVIMWIGIAIVAARALVITLSLPEKYSLTLGLGLVVAPFAIIFRDKEKLLMGAFLFSLPISMGYMLMERVGRTSSTVPFDFQLYLSDTFLILLVSLQLFKVLFTQQRSEYSIWQSKLIIPLILWIVMGFVSLVPAIDRPATFIEIFRMGRYLLIFTCVFHYVKGREEVHFILKLLLIALVCQAILMLAQFVTDSLLIQFPGDTMGAEDRVAEGLRPSGTMTHSSHFAKFSGLILPIALAYIFFAPKLRNKLLMLSIWACGSVALVLTISRAGLVTWLLSMILFLSGAVILRIVPIRQTVPLFLTSALLIIVSAGLLYSIGGKRLKNRGIYDTSAAARIPMWNVALNVIKTNPITGVGLKNYILIHQNYDNTPERISTKLPDSPVHNLFLLYAAEIGIPGLLFFLWFIWKLVRSALGCASCMRLLIDKALFLSIPIGVTSLLLQSITGKGVTDHIIHLSIVSILGGCVAKQYLLLSPHIKTRNYPAQGTGSNPL